MPPQARKRLCVVAQGVSSAAAPAGTDSSEDAELRWVPGEPAPASLRGDPFLSALVPRPTAWVSVHGAPATSPAAAAPMVCLLEGFNASSDRPPTVMFAATALPALHLEQLQKTGLCCLSVATPREFPAIDTLAKLTAGGKRGSTTFGAAGLEPAPRLDGRPPAVASSPCQMDCRLLEVVELGGGPAAHTCGSTRPEGQGMVLLLVEDFTISGSVLVRQAGAEGQDTAALPSTNPDVRQIAAKLEAALVQPLASLGEGWFGHVADVSHMLRPRQTESGGGWIADSLQPAPAPPPTQQPAGAFPTVRYNYAGEDSCSLGYNPMKQICQPRPVGWISTYESGGGGGAGRVAHIAPYSFFADVGRGDRPMVPSSRPAAPPTHQPLEYTGRRSSVSHAARAC